MEARRCVLERDTLSSAWFKHILLANSSDIIKVSKGAKIKNRHNQVPHLTQDTNGKVTNSQLDSTNENQETSLSQQVTTRQNKQTRTKAKQSQDRKSIKDPKWNGQ